MLPFKNIIPPSNPPKKTVKKPTQKKARPIYDDEDSDPDYYDNLDNESFEKELLNQQKNKYNKKSSYFTSWYWYSIFHF